MKAFSYPISPMYTFVYDKLHVGTNIDFIDTDNSAGDANVQSSPSSPSYDFVGFLKFDDDDPAQAVDCYHEGFNINTTGAIEILIILESSNDLTITLYDGASRLIQLIFDGSEGDLDYDRGAGSVEIYGSVATSTWYILSIDVDIDAGVNGQFSVQFRNSAYTVLGSVSDIEFENNATTVDKIRFTTVAGELGTWWINAVGITAEGGYTKGDIQYAATDVTSFMVDTLIYDGIFPYNKEFFFSCHPDDKIYFAEDNVVNLVDDSSSDLFVGLITSEVQDEKGIYHFKAESFSNEIFDRTYNKSYSGDDTDTKLKDLIDNGLKHIHWLNTIVNTATNYNYEYKRSCAYLPHLARFLEREVLYIEPNGLFYSKAYDGLTATGKSWTMNDGNQEVWFIDLPNIRMGYFKGNTGITSASVRYKNDTPVVRPATPSETFKKKRLNEYRDPKIQAATEANQLGDNLFSIFSKDTIFIALRIEGEGWLQPGETIELQSAIDITITQDDFLIVKVVYDPKFDVYESMILSDNIITLDEFNDNFDTTPQQVHTAILQSFENQSKVTNMTVSGTTTTFNGDVGIGQAPARALSVNAAGDNIVAEFISTDAAARVLITDSGGTAELDNTGGVFAIEASSDIQIKPDNDLDDHWYFSTVANVAQMLPIEDKVHNIGSAILSADHMYSDDFDNTSPFKEFTDPLTDLKNIKPNTEKTKLDYNSLPDFVRTHTRDPSKHIWGKKQVIDKETGEPREVDYIVERASKDVIEAEGLSINRMVIFLYQVCQEQQKRIDELEDA